MMDNALMYRQLDQDSPHGACTFYDARHGEASIALCRCGWASPPSATTEEAAEAWTRHREPASPPPAAPRPDVAPKCEICGEPMAEGEGMFKFHGYSGPCPKPALPRPAPVDWKSRYTDLLRLVRELEGHIKSTERRDNLARSRDIECALDALFAAARDSEEKHG